ncbi:MAG: choice-of-anchor D domain-containing protein [Archangium sp.]|nr:choice-of-anchor D domain-containing protein [Archangium sp.]
MRRQLAFPSAALASFVLVFTSACNCGKPIVTNTMSSIALEGDTLDFGVVAEGTSKGGKFRVNNNGRAPVNIGVIIGAGSSTDFTLGTVPTSVEAGGFIEVPVVFTPIGPGSDVGTAEILEMGGMTPLIVHLKGGPIEPFLDVLPDPVDFRPSTMPQETRMVQLKSVGTSALTINAVGVAANGNPDFSVDGPTMPTRLLPGEFVTARVVYQRSMNIMNGYMEVLSDDSDAGLRQVLLIPDRPTACSDTLDNDNDGRADFPNDPGCQNAQDDDEYNPAQCVTGAMRMCGSADGGFCSGTQACINGLWSMCNGANNPQPETCDNQDEDCNGIVDNGVSRGCWTLDAGLRGVGNCRDGMEVCSQGMWIPNCMGQVGPSAEVCGNSIDENCNGLINEGCPPIDGGCNPNGLYTLDAGRITYACCDGLGIGPLVDIDIDRFLIQNNASSVRPQPTQPQTSLLNPSPAATCPNGTFHYSRTITGTCDEIYTLTGTFVGPNTFVGQYTVEFMGQDCVGNPLCGGDDCINQTWNISAGR